MKKQILIFAIATFGLFSANAATPKSDAKAATETKARVDGPLYWFPTENDGTISDPSGIDPAVQPTETLPCDGTSTNMCSRGYTLEETHIVSGKRVPLNPNAGEEAFKD